MLSRLYVAAEPDDLTVDSNGKKMLPNPVADAIRSMREYGLLRSHVTLKGGQMRYSLTERGRRAVEVLATRIKGDGEA